MAKILLGAMITNISGSIGGTTFRRTPYGVSVGRKSAGYSRNTLLANKSLGNLRAVRNMWYSLDIVLKKQWEYVASVNSFPDRFGNQIFLSGRMFFIKCNSPLYSVGATFDVPTLFNTNTNRFAIDSFIVDTFAHTSVLQVLTSGTRNYFLIAYEVGKKAVNKPSFTRREISNRVYNHVDFSIDGYAELMAKYPYLKAGDVVRVYVRVMNDFGYQGLTLTTTTIVV